MRDPSAPHKDEGRCLGSALDVTARDLAYGPTGPAGGPVLIPSAPLGRGNQTICSPWIWVNVEPVLEVNCDR
jgi:hypothetical protein